VCVPGLGLLPDGLLLDDVTAAFSPLRPGDSLPPFEEYFFDFTDEARQQSQCTAAFSWKLFQALDCAIA
jgi:hypothetical protein